MMRFFARLHLAHVFGTVTAVISGGAVAVDAIHQTLSTAAPFLGPKVQGALVVVGALAGLFSRLDKAVSKKPAPVAP